METVRREVEIDTKLADLYEEEVKLLNRLASLRTDLARAAGVKAEYVGRQRVFRGSTESFVEAVKAKVADAETASWDKRNYEATLADYDETTAKLVANREATKPLDAIFERERWSRFFLVLNNNGHIHSSMQCSTCNRLGEATRFAWLPELSGLTEKDAVDAHGAILCTVCFPTAPVEWTHGISKAAQAEKDERAAAKAARDAAKAAKAIFDLDGEVLKDKDGYEIKTDVTARRELSRALQYEYMDYGNDWTVYAERLAAAIANKTGESADELLSKGRVKAKKSVDAEQKKWGR